MWKGPSNDNFCAHADICAHNGSACIKEGQRKTLGCFYLATLYRAEEYIK